MHAVILLLGLLSQDFPASVKPNDNALDSFTSAVQAERRRALEEQASSREASYEEHEFIARFNNLVAALSRFSEKYKKQHVIDVKTVASIKKAYQELERADAWFKVQKWPVEEAAKKP
jgi:head-tail adaptor